MLVFLSSFPDESRVAQYQRAIILHEELRETKSCGADPCRAAVLTPSPSPGFQERLLYIHNHIIYSRKVLSQPWGKAYEESQSPNLGVGWEQTKSNPVSPGFISLSCTCSPIHEIPQCLLIPWTVSLKYIVTKEHVTIIMNKPSILTHTWPSLSVPLWFCLVNVLCSLSCTATHTYPKMTSETIDRL